MKKIYVKPEAETIDLLAEEMIMNNGPIDGSIGIGEDEDSPF